MGLSHVFFKTERCFAYSKLCNIFYSNRQLGFSWSIEICFRQLKNLLTQIPLGRKINTGHLISVLVGLFAVICCEFLVFQSDNGRTYSSDSFILEPTLSQDQTYAYIYCLLSRFCHGGACIPFRKIRVNDLNNEGEISKPVVRQESALYRKALFNLNEKKLLSKANMSLKDIDELSKKQNKLDEQELKLLQILRNQDKFEASKVDRNRGMSKRYGAKLIQRNKEKAINKVHVEQQLVLSDRTRQVDKAQDSVANENLTDDNQINVGEQIDRLERQQEQQKVWAIQMSEEMQEIIKDYKFYELHEHLFDGQDDILLSKLDEIFDSTSLDCELFGTEVPSHFNLMTVVGGFLSVPLFIIMHLLSGGDPFSFMLIRETDQDKIDFYQYMFNNRWETIVILITISILYTLKPITTTNFVLSIQSPLTYVAVELAAKIFFIFTTMILVESNAYISAMEATGLSLSLLSQIMYYHFSDKFKDQIQVQSACDSLKNIFEYESIEELEKIEKKLQMIASQFSTTEALRILFDIVISRNKKQFDYPSISTLDIQRKFDFNYQKTTSQWGGGYPRPAYEFETQSHVIRDRNIEEVDKPRFIKVQGKSVYDLSSLKDARNQWARIDATSNKLDSSDNKQSLISKRRKSDFHDAVSRPMNESILSESKDMLMTQQQLVNDSDASESSSENDRYDNMIGQQDEESDESRNNEQDYDHYEVSQKRLQSMIIKENVSINSDQLNLTGIIDKSSIMKHAKTQSLPPQQLTIEQNEKLDFDNIQDVAQDSSLQVHENIFANDFEDSNQNDVSVSQSLNDSSNLKFKKRSKKKKTNLQKSKQSLEKAKTSKLQGAKPKKIIPREPTLMKFPEDEENEEKKIMEQEIQERLQEMQKINLPSIQQSNRRGSVWVQDLEAEEDNHEELQFHKMKD
ncbi:UNKNOWN [Stylonychia lemnae]|uniref:Uncharacterized protein n=1 Tax=Stylonychia lemnae TaxID=5949 RepID=A0A078AJU4_STYLE|nr:UNKNOWN [Stylonychia lemnae]|eukprot:CDW82444.1 UNKNOWN [Stylonychia lemnae]